MQRNTEALSTRDLASPNELAGDVKTSDGDTRDPASAQASPGLRDQASAVEDRRRLPVDGQTHADTDEPGPAATDERTRLPADKPAARPDEILTETSASDQTVEASSPDATVDTERGGGGDPVEDQPARSTHAQATLDQDTAVASASAAAATSDSDAGGSLLSADMNATFQERWKDIQTRFVDQPRGAVEDADGLVANLMQQLAEGFAKERELLEAQWGRGEDISTEDLRVALQRYRTFFRRLLST